MPAAKKFTRLFQMSADEIFTRARQAFEKCSDSLRYKLGMPIHIAISAAPVRETAKFFFSVEEIPAITKALAARRPDAVAQLISAADNICAHRFNLLGYSDLDFGRDIRWHTDVVNGVTAPLKPWHKIKYLDFAEVGDAKVTWELSRHQHLSVLARAYLFTRQQKYLDELQSQWRSWQAANPYPLGVNWASSLESAFRSMSWIWVLQLLSNGELPEQFRADVIESLALHGRHIEKYLSTYFSANTHLLGEAVALFFIGTLYPQIGPANRWKRLGWETILVHAQKKVLPDGAYFEQSTYYHVYALDMFLHARILADRNGIEIPKGFDVTLRKMLEYLAALHSGAVPPCLGDDDGGRFFDGRRNRVEHLRDPLCVGAAFYQCPRFKLKNAQPTEELIWVLGEKAAAAFEHLSERPPIGEAQSFPHTGTYVMTNAPGTVLTIDAGPLGGDSAGHGHADALSVNLTVSGEAVLVDPGTYQYVGKDDQRARFRTTQAHNTLTLNGQSQATPLSPFSWENIPNTDVETWVPGETFDFFLGSHHGYKRRGAVHRRWVFNLKSQYFVIGDVLAGKRECLVDIAWHLAPGRIASLQDGSITGVPGISFVADPEHLRLRNAEYQYSPTYGQTVSASALHQTGTAQLPFASAMMLLTNVPQKATIRQMLFDGDSGMQMYRITRQGSMETLVLSGADLAKPWSVENITSDADFLYLKQDEYGKIIDTIAVNASFAGWNGNEIFRRESAQSKIELMSAGVEH